MNIEPAAVLDNRLLALGGEIWATVRVEMIMQWRRKGFWATFGFLAALLLLLTVQGALFFKQLPSGYFDGQQPTEAELHNLLVYNATAYGAMLMGLVTALLIADRLERDQRLGMIDLQHVTPRKNGGYVLGKFFGNYLAILVPLFFVYLICGLTTFVLGWPPVIISKFVLVFVLIAVPSSAAGIGLILLLTSFLSVGVVQIGFSLLWFEFYIGLGWHGLAASIFNVAGQYVYDAFFPLPPTLQHIYEIDATPENALLNIMALILTGAVALVLTHFSQTFKRYRAERT